MRGIKDFEAIGKFNYSKNLSSSKEGNRNVSRDLDFYNLDVIIVIGYRVNSYQATQFRIWATKILKEYLIKRLRIA
jgi:hypothetical protein